MPIWDKLKSELDRAGRAAQTALDEGRIQLEAMRARQKMDKAAQDLGYAYYRARDANAELAPDTDASLASEVAAAESEVNRLEGQLREIRAARTATVDSGPMPPAGNPPAA